jgi:hypothetical protein
MNTGSFHISREDTIQNVQDKFSHLFPLFTINFYSPNEKTSADNSCVMFCPECRILDINPSFQDGKTEIKDGMTVYEMESEIQHIFGLHAEISSKIGDRIILTSQITHWLLNEKYSNEKLQPEHSPPVYFKDIPFGC